MSTATQVANAAFSLINVETLEGADVAVDTSLRATTFNNLFPMTLRSILAEFNWTFAFRYAELLKQTAPTIGYYTASYDLPDGTDDALKWAPSDTPAVINLLPGQMQPCYLQRNRRYWRKVGRSIQTVDDNDVITIGYIADLAVDDLPEWFVSVVTYAIAAAMCSPLRKPEMLEITFAEAKRLMRDAKAQDYWQGGARKLHVRNPLAEARFGGLRRFDIEGEAP